MHHRDFNCYATNELCGSLSLNHMLILMIVLFYLLAVKQEWTEVVIRLAWSLEMKTSHRGWIRRHYILFPFSSLKDT